MYAIILNEVKKVQKENIQKLVGKRIAECRKIKSIKQDELADMLGKSTKTIQRYESGDIDLSLSLLAEISDVLGVSMNYLIGYDSSHIDFESVSDVIAALFKIKKKNELDYTINISKPITGSGDIGDWFASITFKGNNANAIYNSNICLVLEKLKDKYDALETYWIDYETIEAWEKSTIEYHKKAFLTDKKIEVLDSTELIKKRNELFDKKVQEMFSEKLKEQDDKK